MTTSTTASPLAIEIDQLAVAYDGHFVLRDVNLQVADGDITVIVGGSGCGKSPFERIIGSVSPASDLTGGLVFGRGGLSQLRDALF